MTAYNRPRVLTLVLTLGAIVLACWLALLFLVWRGQERVVFQPPAWPDEPLAPGVERIDFTGADGQPLFAFVVEPQRSAMGARRSVVLVVFHGNAEVATWGIDWARAVARRTGARVVLAEYRGYAGLPGRPTYEGTRRDALATWAMARERLGATAESTAVYGHSLGSAVATELAIEIRPRALVLESPMSSARAMAALMPLPGLTLLWPAIARVHFDTRARVAALDVPVWVAHGRLDRVIPFRMGEEVYAAARVKGELLAVDGAGHNDVRAVGGERYWGWLGRAMSSE